MIGGFAINLNKEKRFFNNEIISYNVESSQYEKIRFNHCLRSHASTIFSNNKVEGLLPNCSSDFWAFGQNTFLPNQEMGRTRLKNEEKEKKTEKDKNGRNGHF